MDEDTIKTIAASIAAAVRKDIAESMTPLQNKPLYTTREAAAFLGVKLSYIYELVRNNKLPYYRSRGGKLMYIRQADLLKWAKATFVPSISSIRER